MPLKPHPTDPEKMVYTRREYNLPKPWQGLTEEETVEIALNAFALPEFPLEARLQLQNELVIAMNTQDSRMMMFAALIEAKLKEKNR